MTIGGALSDLNNLLNADNIPFYYKPSIKAVMDTIILDSLEKQDKWIPISERLPEIHVDVILSLRSLDIEVGFRAETEPYFYCHCADSCYIDTQNVLAWMPLPDPYKAESEE